MKIIRVQYMRQLPRIAYYAPDDAIFICHSHTTRKELLRICHHPLARLLHLPENPTIIKSNVDPKLPTA